MTPTDEQIEAAVLLKFMTKLIQAHMAGPLSLEDFAAVIESTASEIRTHAASEGAPREAQDGLWKETVQMLGNKILEATGDERTGKMIFEAMPPILADEHEMDYFVSRLSMEATVNYSKEFPEQVWGLLDRITDEDEASKLREIIADSLQHKDG